MMKIVGGGEAAQEFRSPGGGGGLAGLAMKMFGSMVGAGKKKPAANIANIANTANIANIANKPNTGNTGNASPVASESTSAVTSAAAPPGTGKLDAGTSLSSLPCGLDHASTAPPTNLNRMLGGQQIAATKYPWYVMVAKKGAIGSGSIISKNYILTCEHCLPDSGEVEVRAEWNTGKSQNIKSSRYWKHPTVDMGIIELPRPLMFSPTLGPVCLSRETTMVGDRATALGWHHPGAKWEIREASQIPISSCPPEENHLICFDAKESNGRGIEGGDSGGVLMMREKSGKGRWIQVGVHAFVVTVRSGDGSVTETVFKAVRVSSFFDWILGATGLVD